MSDDRFDRVMALFEEALEQPSSTRSAWLEEACRDDPSLFAEVLRLVTAHHGTGLLDDARDDLARVFEDDIVRALPQCIGPFEPIEEIGRGGMGIVYKANDPRLARFVAVKLLPPLLEDDPSARDRLLREAKAASALDHPNICTIYDVGETEDGLVFIAMAYYPGRTLADVVASGPLSLTVAVGIARQIAFGLAHAHDAGIVHRDIKPGNIVITDKGVVKILDFGIAKREGGSEITTPGFHLGTIAYMSPERIDGRDSGPAMDIWSLGVVLAEMVTGVTPFRGDNAAEVVLAIESGVPGLDALPEELRTICRKALARDPRERFQSAAAMADALGAVVLEGVQLPSEPTSFVGRRSELALGKDLLSRARLVSITGPGGTGKTRLALALARAQAERFKDGVHFIALESLQDQDLVLPAIVKGLKLGDARVATLERLVRALSKKELLIVLDNFEQVVDAGTLVAKLLEACPSVSFLVTSRSSLHLSGEHELPLSPLDEDAASELFVARARAAAPMFTLDEAKAAHVAEICRRLDRLPLAIELAAARSRIFEPEALLARLDTEIDRERGGPRDRPERHQTVSSAIAWSYELLEADEKRVFRGLGIFSGSFTVEAAEQIVDAGPGALVEQSLVQTVGNGRFVMLSTIRRFARDKLEGSPEREREAVSARHRDYFLALAERAAPELTGPHQTQWLDRLDAEHDELRALVATGGEAALRLAAALWRFWLVRGHLREGRRRLDQLLDDARGSENRTLAASVLNGAGTLAHNAGDNGRARELLEESLSIWRELGDARGTAVALNNLAWVACEQSDLDTAVQLSEEALARNRELADRRGMALSLNNLGWVANYRGDGEKSRAYHAESLGLRRAIGDERGIAFALANLAWGELLGGSAERARVQLDEAEALIRRVGDPIVTGWTLTTKGRLQMERGDLDAAAGTFGQALLDWHEGGQSSGFAWTLTLLARVAIVLGRFASARELAEGALEHWRKVGSVWGEACVKQVLATVESEEGNEALAEALREESRATLEKLGAATAFR